MTVDVTSYQDAFANFDKGLAILNLIKPLDMSTKPRDILPYPNTLLESSVEISISKYY